METQYDVQRATVIRHWKRDLDLPSKLRRNALSEARDELDVRTVPKRWTGRKKPHGQIEPDRGGDGSKLYEPYFTDETHLDPADPGLRHPGWARGLRLSQSCRESSLAQFLADRA
jgi:hypothetical protein